MYCYGSSPTLFCNNFHDDANGEMYILNGYPILWSANGTDAGSNTFVATDKTLITMTNGYPIVANGLNKFTIYGSSGYFMADLSKTPPIHYIKGNEWYPANPQAKTFLPSDLAYWLYSPTTSFGNCTAPKGGSGTGAQASFETGFAAEMAGNTAEAQSAYEQTIALYPDSSWAEVAAVRLLNTQQLLDSNYSALQSYYQAVATTYASDTSLVETVQNLATQTLVEDHQFDPALTTYEQLIYAAVDPIDSACAAIDYAVTTLRRQYEDSSSSGLDSYLPQTSIAMVMNAMRQIQDVLPKAPEASHENFTPPPTNFVLEQNYPNPFNPVTAIRYYLPLGSDIRLDVFNLMGQKVATLTTGYQENGYHNVSWNAQGFASGVYVYQLRAGNSIQTQKMLLLK
jgi:tetratricopeptide (TPR) repeat protein